jgi:hypothetical protein
MSDIEDAPAATGADELYEYHVCVSWARVTRIGAVSSRQLNGYHATVVDTLD